MNTRSLLTAGSALALAGALTGALAGFTTGRATAPTPEECITALADADQTITLMADALIIAGDSVEYAAAWDASGLEQSSLEIEEITTDLEAVDYSTSSAECRGRR